MLGIVRKLRDKLAGSQNSLIGKLAEAIRLRGKVDEDLMDELEDILLRADTGVDMTTTIMDNLRDDIRQKKITTAEEVQASLQTALSGILLSRQGGQEDFYAVKSHKPHVIIFLGVNGVGKTTTIAKIAHNFRQQGRSVLIIAGDTFRAAAIEQLHIWAERAGAEIIKTQQGGDPSAVVFDGIQAAQSRNTDIVLIDTAGRQHTKQNLMQELAKMIKTIKKLIPEAPHEVLLILDATTGQNAISQTKTFHEVAQVTGLVLTKLDGSAKGGIIFNIVHTFNLPVRFIGIGETLTDLQPFDPETFVEAIFSCSEPVTAES